MITLRNSILAVKDVNMNYYDAHFKEYVDGTVDCDMSFQYNFFEKYLNKNAKTILDIGFGSCRDMLHFSNMKFEVYGIDPTKSFYDNALKKGFNNVFCFSAQEISFVDLFDGIWACASLLHVKKEELNDVFKKCEKSLKKNGVMYCSFKYGEFSYFRDDRYFIDLTEESIKEYLTNTNLIIIDTCLSFDVRPERKDEKWLNVILKKNMTKE
jgi:SAM-dependent methyltransferase